MIPLPMNPLEIVLVISLLFNLGLSLSNVPDTKGFFIRKILYVLWLMFLVGSHVYLYLYMRTLHFKVVCVAVLVSLVTLLSSLQLYRGNALLYDSSLVVGYLTQIVYLYSGRVFLIGVLVIMFRIPLLWDLVILGVVGGITVIGSLFETRRGLRSSTLSVVEGVKFITMGGSSAAPNVVPIVVNTTKPRIHLQRSMSQSDVINLRPCEEITSTLEASVEGCEGITSTLEDPTRGGPVRSRGEGLPPGVQGDSQAQRVTTGVPSVPSQVRHTRREVRPPLMGSMSSGHVCNLFCPDRSCPRRVMSGAGLDLDQ